MSIPFANSQVFEGFCDMSEPCNDYFLQCLVRALISSNLDFFILGARLSARSVFYQFPYLFLTLGPETCVCACSPRRRNLCGSGLGRRAVLALLALGGTTAPVSTSAWGSTDRVSACPARGATDDTSRACPAADARAAVVAVHVSTPCVCCRRCCRRGRWCGCDRCVCRCVL